MADSVSEDIFMIRKLEKADINRVADIWLNTNLKAHDFIPAQYWKSNYEAVKEMLPEAEVYVYEDGQKIQGFIGMNGEYIEGIFVSDEAQSQGIGRLLLDYVKGKKSKLLLNVYQKNARAIDFYQREGFKIQREGLDETNKEKEYEMEWKQIMDKEWQELYKAAKKVLKPRDVSKMIEAGGVAAAVESVSGKIYVGVCVDTACTLGICAERNAIFNMLTNGDDSIRRVIAIGREGKAMAPCGACREFMAQLMPEDYRDIEVMMDYDNNKVMTLGELTPEWWL